MNFDDMVKRSGGEVVGGQLIVRHDNKHLLIGRHMSGVFLPEPTPEAEEFLASLKAEPAEATRRRKAKGADTETSETAVVEPEVEAQDGEDHVIDVADEILTEDKAG